MHSGRLPWSDDDRARAREICSATYSLLGAPWATVSTEAKSFISELIQVDPTRRLSAERALYHDWFDPISHLRDKYIRDSDGGDDAMEVAAAPNEVVGSVISPLDETLNGRKTGDMPPPLMDANGHGKATVRVVGAGKGQKRRQNPVEHADDECDASEGGKDAMEVATTVVTNSTGVASTTVSPRKKVRAAARRVASTVTDEEGEPAVEIAPRERRSARKK
jgi:hypothetical protein